MQAHGRASFESPGKGWIFLVAAVALLAVAVPVAWATFNDVPPSNPFYNDINAVQGAGITSGCGGGNFCPNDNITRQAEAAFVHRAAARMAYMEGPEGQLDPAGQDLGSLTIQVGGVAGGTQFVSLNAAVTTYIASTSGCPCQTGFYITDDAFHNLSDTHFNLNDAVAEGGTGVQSGGATVVVPVTTGASHTFHVVSFLDSGTGTVSGYAEMTAMTAPFGSTGDGTLNAQTAPGGKLSLRTVSPGGR